VIAEFFISSSDRVIRLPIVDWSLKYGDLRIAHFVGMHAMQVLLLLSRYLIQNNFLTILVAFVYASVATLVLVIALQGKPIVKINRYETKSGCRPMKSSGSVLNRKEKNGRVRRLRG
jgi:hypothetical protein